MSTHRIVTGGFFLECADCGGARYAREPYVNGRGDVLTAWACDGCEGDDAVLCAVDIMLDGNEEYDTRADHTGRAALYVTTFDEYDD